MAAATATPAIDANAAAGAANKKITEADVFRGYALSATSKYAEWLRQNILNKGKEVCHVVVFSLGTVVLDDAKDPEFDGKWTNHELPFDVDRKTLYNDEVWEAQRTALPDAAC